MKLDKRAQAQVFSLRESVSTPIEKTKIASWDTVKETAQAQSHKDYDYKPPYVEYESFGSSIMSEEDIPRDTVNNTGLSGSRVKSDGGTTSYYQLPPDAKELLDLIEYKKMTFPVANIFKACYRLGEKEGADLEYDLRKILFFAERALLEHTRKKT
jgi:hypothetical protein